MKIKLNNKYIRWGLTAFGVIAASICFYYLIFHASNLKANITEATNVLMPIVFGLVMGYLLTPLLNFTEQKVLLPLCSKLKIKSSVRRNKIVRAIGILITSVLFFSLIYILIAMLLSQIIPSIQSIVANFDTYINNISTWLDNLLSNNPDIKKLVTEKMM